MKITVKFISFLLFFLSNVVCASLITVTGVSGTGVFTNNVSLISDGVFPVESSIWTNSESVFWNGLVPTFVVDFGSVYTVDDVLVSVDNNDDYSVQWSQDLSTWNTLFNISVGDGEISFGMDTMSTDSFNSEYVPAIDFASIQARYLRITATNGDNSYSIGEFQAFGSNVSMVTLPEPMSLALFNVGLVFLVLMGGVRMFYRKTLVYK